MVVSDPKWSMDADGVRISFKAPNIEAAKKLCLEMERGKGYDLTVKKQSRKRSLSANSLMWAVLGEMCRELRKTDPKVTPDDLYRGYIKDTGNYDVAEAWEDSLESIRKMWESNGLGWIAEVGEPIEEADGMVKYTVRLWHGSSQYDSREMKGLLDSILQDAAALGICSESTQALMEAYPDGQ